MIHKHRYIIIATLVLLTIMLATIFGTRFLMRIAFSPRSSGAEIRTVDTVQDVEVVAQNLEIPWDVALLPDGDLLVTERPGTLLRINEQTQEHISVSGVHHIGEGGLLGIALDPDFAQNSFIYLYHTYESQDSILNRVVRYEFIDNTLRDATVVIDAIPGSRNHDGGQIAFGPDGMLYVTTGDAGNPSAAQDTQSLLGKILRLHADGSIPDDNPFNNAVYSYGHRNPQGLAWDDRGRLWSTEHGRSGIQSGYDEVNLIISGGNYGWPDFEGDETGEGVIAPVLHSGADDTWAPASLSYHDETLYWGGLRGQALYAADIANDTVRNFREYFKTEYGRVRAVIAHDNTLFVTTSNTDGRGSRDQDDDQLIRIPFTFLK